MFFVFVVVSLLFADVTALESASRRSDDADYPALMTVVQRQAEVIQRNEASLQAMQNQIAVLQQSVASHTAALNNVQRRLDTQVFFTASTSASDLTMSGDSAIRFDAVVTNIGGAYNPTTGVFTAPASGVYVFYAQLMMHEQSPYFHWAIAHSRGTTSYLCVNSVDDPNRFDKSSCLATARIQKGDQVFVRRVDGSYNLQGGPYCSFSGYLTSLG
ncbi:hypothetical protein ACOMHN_012631 [Nucella lapillus]